VAELADAQDLKGPVRLFSYAGIVERSLWLLLESRTLVGATDTRNTPKHVASGTEKGTGTHLKPALRFTVAEVAQMTGLSVRTLRRRIHDGDLRTVREKGRLFITAEDARIWLGHHLDYWKLRPSGAWPSGYVSIRAYEAITGRPQREVRHLIDKGAMTTVRIGGRVFVAGEEVDALLRSDTQNR